MVSDKGKQPAVKSSGKGKRKVDDDKTAASKKRKNRGVLQFFDEAAAVSDGGYSSGDSIFDDDFFEEEQFDLGINNKNDEPKSHNLPVFPKEEEFEEEFDKMMEERYKNASVFLRFAEDEPVIRKFVEEDSSIPSIKDPTTWKVKCAVGRERHSSFCLMQKYVDLQDLGTKLKIISAYAVEHVKGHFFVEAEKQSDVIEACKGLASVYATRVAPLPRSEVPNLLSVRTRRAEISAGMWSRVKSGTYKGDLAQVVAVNDVKRRATVKLIPRIDLQAMAEKFGGGVASKRTGAPAPKLISSSELDEFRPLIQYRRDRETGQMFQVLDGIMLKDGYVFKRVAIDSLSFWGVMPSEDELLKFQPPENNESAEVEWLTQLYGDKKKKRTVNFEKGGEKGEGSSTSSSTKKYELFDLVSMGPKDFGLIVGIEKDDYKILKEGAEGHIVQNVGVHEIKNGPFDGKFTAMDQHRKPISVNDAVRILEGPLKDRQGIVKQIYRGVIFIYDDNELEHGGFICSRAQCCEKIKLSVDSFPGKGGEPSLFGSDDPPSSPKSPLCTEKPWEARENKRDFNQGERDGFSVGQTLRIRVGPLKGYTCRVIGVRRSDVTVKLDSQHKVLTVKSEHLVEVRGRSSTTLISEEPDSSSKKTFDLLGNEGSTDWTGGAGSSANDGGWNAGSSSAPWSSWSGPPSSGLVTESGSADPSNSGNGLNKDVEDDGWGSKVAPKQNSSWGTSAADNKVVSGNDQSDGCQKDGESWGNAAAKGSSSGSGLDSWGKTITQKEDAALPNTGGESWGNAAAVTWGRNNDQGSNDGGSWNKQKASVVDGGSAWNSWNKQGGSSSNETALGSSKDGDSWGNSDQKMKAPAASSGEKTKDENDGWNSWKKPVSSLDTGKADFCSDGWGKGGGLSNSSLNKPTDGFEQDGGSSWNKDGGAWKKQDGGSSWGKSVGEITNDGNSLSSQQDSGAWGKTSAGAPWDSGSGGNSWKKNEGGSSWGKRDGDSSGAKQDAGSSWNKDGGGSSWNKQDGGSSWSKPASVSDDGSTWMKDGGGNKSEGGASWTKPAGGSSWNKNNEDSSWGKQGASSWGQQDGGSSWSQRSGSSFMDKGNEDQSESFGGSGGRRGRGGRDGRGRGGRGDRGRFGRGRSFDRDQSSGWSDGGGRGSSGGWRGGGRSGGRSSWSSNPGGSSGSWNDGGSDNQNQTESWSKSSSFGADGGSTWGGTQDKGSAWGNQGGGSWKDTGEKSNSGSVGVSWGKDKDSSGGWNKPESWNTSKASDVGGSSSSWGQHQAGDSSKSSEDNKWSKEAGSSWGKNEDTGNDKVGWKKPEEGSWGKKDDTGAGNNWGSAGDSSGGWKKPGGDDTWGKNKENSGAGSSWGKNEDTGNDEVGWKKPEEGSWGKKDDTGAGNNWGSAGDSSGGWKKPGGDDTWGKNKENSGAGAWGSREETKNDAGGSSWNKDGGSSDNNKQQEDSSWGSKKATGGSSWSNDKQDGGGDGLLGSKPGAGGDSSWKAGGASWGSGGGEGSGGGWKSGGSSWSGSSGGEEGSGGGWKSGGSWNGGGDGGSRGGGDGGRRGRGGFGRGGRDQFSGGRSSFGRGSASSSENWGS